MVSPKCPVFLFSLESHPLRSDSYDRDLKDIFPLQYEIMASIMTALLVKLTEGEQASVLDNQAFIGGPKFFCPARKRALL